MNDKFWFVLCLVYGFGVSALAGYLNVPIEAKMAAFFASVLVVVVGGLIGGPTGWYLAKDADVDSTAFKVISWCGLIGWVIPIVGGTLATMSYMFKRRSTFNESFYTNLGNIAGLLAITNAMIGGGWEAYDGLTARQANRSQTAMNATLQRHGIDPEEMTGERSTERCQYAALEAWSREDLDRYCRGR
ncbi:tripartite tricarboxylate transporter permease [Porphyrobacter sp. YT40]|uniref:tripartite tricarboxylate transporter permease n=1 Tax=Porphyrobacter sp. YT40 TaxID=2547601 RepID=UPI0011440FA6|nr:tripartite tricarboxylate transporter permease [Porphyrobacter sp. YT40]QDH34381.1 tripartite tricarboxylate transporter permease [Porphyrobacter sp. YT40]